MACSLFWPFIDAVVLLVQTSPPPPPPPPPPHLGFRKPGGEIEDVLHVDVILLYYSELFIQSWKLKRMTNETHIE